LEFVKLIIDLKGRTATVRWHIARGSTAGSETADCWNRKSPTPWSSC